MASSAPCATSAGAFAAQAPPGARSRFTMRTTSSVCACTHWLAASSAKNTTFRTVFISGRTSGQCPLNDDFLHVGGAFINLAHPHVAVNALDGEVAHIAVAAQGLDGGAADFLGHLAGEQLGHGGFFQAG